MCGFPLTTQEPNCRLLEFPDSQDKNLSNWLFRGQPWMEPMQTHIWEELPGRNHRDSLLGKSDRPGDFHFWVRDDHYHDGDCGCGGTDDPFYETTFFWLLVASNLSSFSCWSLNLANFSSFSACAIFGSILDLDGREKKNKMMTMHHRNNDHQNYDGFVPIRLS